MLKIQITHPHCCINTATQP